MTEERPDYGATEKLAPTPEDAQEAFATIEALRQEVEESRNKYLRTAADLDNLRKRSAREVELARKVGAERLAQAILPVRDSMEAGLALAASADTATLLEGQRATLRLLDEAMTSAGIRQISPDGEPFDPTKHEALSLRAADGVPPNSVLEVIQKGYEINDRLLRAAKVIVSRDHN